MQTYLYKLNFQGPTHFGETGIDLENISERITSDTLFSALVNSIRTIDGMKVATDFVNGFVNNPPFLISSLFLYRKNKFFLPKPASDEHITEDVKREMGKELKKLTWLTSENYLKWISGKAIDKSDIGRMTIEHDEYKKSFKIEIRPRVSLDRTTQNSNIYHCGYVHFEKDAGLYGLVAFQDEKNVVLFKKTLETLGEIGVGGEKTYGAGTFHVDVFQKIASPFTEIFTSPSSRYFLLSLYHPSPEEIQTLQPKLCAYGVVRKKGWIATGRNTLPLKRKSVGFFTEGSVFLDRVRGCLVDVTPDGDHRSLLEHKIYRYGYAFTAPMRMGGNDG